MMKQPFILQVVTVLQSIRIFSATLGDLNIINALISHEGIELDVRDFRGWTPLAIAKTNGFTDICNALVAGGATPLEELEPDSR